MILFRHLLSTFIIFYNKLTSNSLSNYNPICANGQLTWLSVVEIILCLLPKALTFYHFKIKVDD